MSTDGTNGNDPAVPHPPSVPIPPRPKCMTDPDPMPLPPGPGYPDPATRPAKVRAA